MKKKVYILLCFTVFCIGLTLKFSAYESYARSFVSKINNSIQILILEATAKYQHKEKKPVWMNIFIHGTVGCVFSFLDISSIQGDRIENSIYKKTVKLMRKNHFFYQDQPILQRGLVRIEPSFDFITRNDQYYAAYPVLKAYEEVSDWVSKNKDENLYYIFGWSGYLSQKRRRSESLRLYNQITEEVNTLRSYGIHPKIRILTHSHGGNLSLNLAGIYHYLNDEISTASFYNEFEIGTYVKDLFDKLLRNSFEKEVAITKKGQKRFDYYPDKNIFQVDELVMLGTPIQEETSLFTVSPFFKKTFNIYSDGDIVQGMDFATTIKKKSLQRIDNINLENRGLCQIKIAINDNTKSNNLIKKAPKQEDNPTWWQIVLGLKDTARKSQDPTHKELWFIVPNDGSVFNFLRPIPTVVFYPIIRYLQSTTNIKDGSLIITKNEDHCSFKVIDSNQEVYESINIDIKMLEGLQEKFVPWINPRNGANVMKGIMNQLITINRNLSKGF